MQDVLYTALPLIVLLSRFAVAPSQLRARPRVEPVTFQRVSTPCPQLARKASFLSGVQSRPEFVRSDELVSVQGAADGNKKNVSLERPSHGLHSVTVLSVVCSVPQIVSLERDHPHRGSLACLSNVSQSSRHELSSSFSRCPAQSPALPASNVGRIEEPSNRIILRLRTSRRLKSVVVIH